MRAPKKEILHQSELNVPGELLRFATPAVVADYRAERLKCNTIAEIGCGIGAQTIAFSKTCKKIIALEINPNAIEIARNNIKRLGIKNVEFIDGDALFAGNIKKIKAAKPDIIFCDTARKEKGERTISDLQPDIWKLIEEYSKISEKIAIEVPPFTNDLKRLEEDFEKEFVSIDKKLNRLNLYFNKLKKCGRSAVSLPSGTRIENREVKEEEYAKSVSCFKYFYLIDPAVPMAGLTNELASELKKVKLIELNKKEFFVSKEKLESSFLEGFRIISVVDNNFKAIMESLKKSDAGKVVLRYNIPPEDYWKERKMYESGLSGKIKVHLFKDIDSKEAILCESLSY